MIWPGHVLEGMVYPSDTIMRVAMDAALEISSERDIEPPLDTWMVGDGNDAKVYIGDEVFAEFSPPEYPASTPDVDSEEA